MVNDHTRHGYRLASITPYDHVNAYQYFNTSTGLGPLFKRLGRIHEQAR